MGRIRNVEIKSISDEVLSKYPLKDFSDDFVSNKEKLKSMPEEFPSKKILNRVAGNIVRLVKRSREEEAKLMSQTSTPVEEEVE